MEIYKTDNLKLFKPLFSKKQIETNNLLKYKSLFDNRNYFNLSPLVINGSYIIFDIDECAKFYGFLENKSKNIISYVFMDKTNYDEQLERANLYLSENDFDKDKYPNTDDCIERYLPFNTHYRKLVNLQKEFNMSSTNAIMLFGISKNFKVVREGTFRCVPDYEIEEFRIIDNELKKSKKHKEIIGGWIYHYIIKKLYLQENFSWNRVIYLLNNDNLKEKIPISTRKILKSTKNFVEIYNKDLIECEKITNPYNKKLRNAKKFLCFL